MICPKNIKTAHCEIQKRIFGMIPEKWDKIYLYASVIDHFNNLQTGEMFFFYYPKGVLKKKAVNVYEVPSKFNIDEKQYLKLVDELYKKIKCLRNECIENDEKAWSNITITIEKQKYKAEYGYEEINASVEDLNERHVIWTYRYLGLPFESFNKKEKEIIKRYINSPKPDKKVFEMPLYTKEAGEDLESINQIDKKFKFVTEEKIEEMEYIRTHIPKSQILK